MSIAHPRLAFALVLLLLATPAALAHGFPVGSEPAPLTAVEAAPGRVVVHMSEPIEPPFSHIRVVGVESIDLARGASYYADGNDSRLAVDVAIQGDGTYVVSWGARWRSDGHDTEGSFAFAVGNASALAGLDAATQSAATPGVLEVALRALVFTGLFAAVGTLGFLLLVDRGRVDDGAPRALRLALVGSLAALMGAAVQLVVGVADGYRVGMLEAMAHLPEAMAATYLPRVHLARVVAAAAMAVLAWRAMPRAALVAGLAALGTLSLGSHAASADGSAWLLPADIVHLGAAAVWTGGLLLLVPALRASDSADVARRFSRLAMASAVLVVLTGAVATSAHLHGDPTRLVTTLYGRLLLAKLILVFGLVALGALNQFLFLPRLRGTSARASLRRSAILEVSLAAGVLIVAGALTAVSPEEVAGGPLTLTEEGTQMRVTVTVSPAALGINTIDATIVDLEAGAPLSTLKNATLYAQPLDASLGSAQTPMVRQADGSYRAGAGFATRGDWVLTVYVQRTDAYDDSVQFVVRV